MSHKSVYYKLFPSMIDTAIFDYLISNTDRHEFETVESLGRSGRILHIDNGKRLV